MGIFPPQNSFLSHFSKAGYRHFDTASFYGNEATLGRALKRSGLPRHDFFVCSKVWNDAQKAGREAVRRSVLQSIHSFDFGGYFDLYLVHWPVPGYFVDTYKELEMLHDEGYLKNLGLSNFSPQEYEELMSEQHNVKIKPVLNQFEVSPFMNRPDLVSYFQEKGILVSSSKALYRGDGFNNTAIHELCQKYRSRAKGCLRVRATPAQVMICWGLQKGLIVIAKTATPSRMAENRDALLLSLTEEEIAILDSLTKTEDKKEREQLEAKRKAQM